MFCMLVVQRHFPNTNPNPKFVKSCPGFPSSCGQ